MAQAEQHFAPGTLYYGDCLDWMRRWPDDCVDLIYLDPPFNSNANYNQLFGRANGNGVSAQVRAFTDTWYWNEAAAQRWETMQRAPAHPAHRTCNSLYIMLGESGMFAYLTYMAERVAEMQRLLKTTGSIYLHCDPTASHYLRLLMNRVFGPDNFMNEIVWGYRTGGASKKRWAKKHDTILYYAKNHEHTFFEQQNETNYYETPFPGEGDAPSPDGKYPKTESVRDVWDSGSPGADEHIKPLLNFSKERLGYPTQKPQALLERIIRASSKEDDVVLDPFCGCGTTIAAAAKLGRQWLGVDISAYTVDLIQERRLKPLGITPRVMGMPQDTAGARRLARDNPFDFEEWAVTRVPGLAPNEIKTGDGGIDGRGALFNKLPDGRRLVLAQVKGGEFKLSQLREFLHVVQRENAAFGVYITLAAVTSPTAQNEAAALGGVQIGAQRFPRVQFWTVQNYFARNAPLLPPLADPFTGKARQEFLFRAAAN